MIWFSHAICTDKDQRNCTTKEDAVSVTLFNISPVSVYEKLGRVCIP
jgi:hypothetical protein